MAYKNVKNIRIENAKIIFRNFKGEASKYNKEGNKNFCVIIEDEKMAKELINEGWNVRTLTPRDEYEAPLYYIQVTVNFDGYMPPSVYMVTKKGIVPMDNESIVSLDWAEIKNIDLSIRPYIWTVQGNTGIKAYLKVMYVTLEDNEFEDKYAGEEYPEEEDLPF